MELRCEAKLHGIAIEDTLLEVKCNSVFCGAGKGVVVLHQFRMTDGKLISTRRFKQPEPKEVSSSFKERRTG